MKAPAPPPPQQNSNAGNTHVAAVYRYHDAKWNPVCNGFATITLTPTKMRAWSAQQVLVVDIDLNSSTKVKIKDTFVRWEDTNCVMGAQFSKSPSAKSFHNDLKNQSQKKPNQRDISLVVELPSGEQCSVSITSGSTWDVVMQKVCTAHSLNAQQHWLDLNGQSIVCMQIVQAEQVAGKKIRLYEVQQAAAVQQASEATKQLRQRIGSVGSKDSGSSSEVNYPGELTIDREDVNWQAFFDTTNIHSSEALNLNVQNRIIAFVKDKGGYRFLTKLRDHKVSSAVLDELNDLAGEVHMLNERRMTPHPKETTLERKKNKRKAPPPPQIKKTEHVAVQKKTSIDQQHATPKRKAPPTPKPPSSPAVEILSLMTPPKSAGNSPDKAPPLFIPPPPPESPPPSEVFSPVGALSPNSLEKEFAYAADTDSVDATAMNTDADIMAGDHSSENVAADTQAVFSDTDKTENDASVISDEIFEEQSLSTLEEQDAEMEKTLLSDIAELADMSQSEIATFNTTKPDPKIVSPIVEDNETQSHDIDDISYAPNHVSDEIPDAAVGADDRKTSLSSPPPPLEILDDQSGPVQGESDGAHKDSTADVNNNETLNERFPPKKQILQENVPEKFELQKSEIASLESLREEITQQNIVPQENAPELIPKPKSEIDPHKSIPEEILHQQTEFASQNNVVVDKCSIEKPSVQKTPIADKPEISTPVLLTKASELQKKNIEEKLPPPETPKESTNDVLKRDTAATPMSPKKPPSGLYSLLKSKTATKPPMRTAPSVKAEQSRPMNAASEVKVDTTKPMDTASEVKVDQPKSIHTVPKVKSDQPQPISAAPEVKSDQPNLISAVSEVKADKAKPIYEASEVKLDAPKQDVTPSVTKEESITIPVEVKTDHNVETKIEAKKPHTEEVAEVIVLETVSNLNEDPTINTFKEIPESDKNEESSIKIKPFSSDTVVVNKTDTPEVPLEACDPSNKTDFGKVPSNKEDIFENETLNKTRQNDKDLIITGTLLNNSKEIKNTMKKDDKICDENKENKKSETIVAPVKAEKVEIKEEKPVYNPYKPVYNPDKPVVFPGEKKAYNPDSVVVFPSEKPQNYNPDSVVVFPGEKPRNDAPQKATWQMRSMSLGRITTPKPKQKKPVERPVVDLTMQRTVGASVISTDDPKPPPPVAPKKIATLDKKIEDPMAKSFAARKNFESELFPIKRNIPLEIDTQSPGKVVPQVKPKPGRIPPESPSRNHPPVFSKPANKSVSPVSKSVPTFPIAETVNLAPVANSVASNSKSSRVIHKAYTPKQPTTTPTPIANGAPKSFNRSKSLYSPTTHPTTQQPIQQRPHVARTLSVDKPTTAVKKAAVGGLTFSLGQQREHDFRSKDPPPLVAAKKPPPKTLPKQNSVVAQEHNVRPSDLARLSRQQSTHN